MQPTSFERLPLEDEIKEIKFIWHVSVGHFRSLVHTHIFVNLGKNNTFFVLGIFLYCKTGFCIVLTYVFFISYNYLFHKLHCIYLLMTVHIMINMNMWLLF